jgi:prophage regulatory protein
MLNNTPAQARLIRLKEVMSQTGISRSHVYVLFNRGEFPQPIKLSEKSVAWLESEVQRWIAQRIANRDDAEVVK